MPPWSVASKYPLRDIVGRPRWPGDRAISPADYPGNKPELELLLQRKWGWNPNTRGNPVDYPMLT